MRVTIIGAGPGGYETAVALAGHGVDVNIVSKGPLGGTCLNEGCIPTKCLCRYAELADRLKTGREVLDVENGGAGCSVNFSKVMAKKEESVSALRSGIEFLMKNPRISLHYGTASFCETQSDGVHRVKVEREDGNEDFLESDYVIIASGSHSASLPVEGAGLPQVLSSSEMLVLKDLPRRLCIIGAGVIGLEFASVFDSFGCEVTVVEYCRNILPRFDVDIAKRLKKELSSRGIRIETSAQVLSVSCAGETGCRADKDAPVIVRYEVKGEKMTVEADKVLMAVGRRPNVDGLGLETAGIVYGPKGIVVDARMRTNVDGVYAIGDVTGGIMLAHAATAQGRIAMTDILSSAGICSQECSVNMDIIPAAVFTRPELAVVGLTEEECKEKCLPYKVYKSFYRANGKAVAMGETEGYVKILASEDANRKGIVLGCHIMGAHASDLIHEVAAVMNFGGTVRNLTDMIHAHPTLSEVLMVKL